MSDQTRQFNGGLVSMHRNTKTQQAYVRHLVEKEKLHDMTCDVCRLIRDKPTRPPDNPLLHQYAPLLFDSVCLIENDFPYENNDGRRVLLHHMLVPREHSTQVLDLVPDVMHEYHETLDKILATGTYDSAYTRAGSSPTASVPQHVHTHLFKFGAKVTKQIYDPANSINEITYEDS